MDTRVIRLVLAAFVILWSAAIFIVLGNPSLKKKDPAVQLFRLPMIGQILYTFLELAFLVLSVASISAETTFSILTESAKAVRLSLGFLTLIFCYNHYRANGISTDNLVPKGLAAIITAFNYAVFAFGLVAPFSLPFVRAITTGILSITLLYAGLIGIFAAIRERNLYLSSWAAYWIAIFSLSYYPFVGTADMLSLSVPFLDSGRSVALQFYPAYFFAVLTITTFFLHKIKISDERDYRKPVQPLSDREIAVAALIRAGKSNKEIAQELGISLPTVKTHTANILKKFNISSRDELPPSGEYDGNTR